MDVVPVSMPRTHRYMGFHHVRRGETDSETDAHKEAICAWLKDRFEIYHVMSQETADSGLHIQWYGESSRAWDKRDTNLHGKNGRLSKHMPERMSTKVKRWGHEEAKKSREENAHYVGKDGFILYLSNGDPADIVGRWEEKRDGKTGKKGGKLPFSLLLINVWNENGKPMDHREIYQMLVTCRVIPWNNYSPQLLYKAADWLLSQVNRDEAEHRMMMMYDVEDRRRFS